MANAVEIVKNSWITLGKKFALFYGALAVVALLNVWVVFATLQELHGAANYAAAAHRLHRAVEAIRFGMPSPAAQGAADTALLRAALAQGEDALRGLRSSAAADLDDLEAAIRDDWAGLAAATRSILDGHAVAQEVEAGRRQAMLISHRIEAAADTQRSRSEGVGETALRRVGGLALLNVALLAGGLAGLHFRIVRPLRALRDAAQAVSAGSYESRIDLAPHDEIGELAKTFNRMADEIQNSLRQSADSMARLKQTNQEVEKFHQALEQSPVSVVITDPNGIIEYVNPRFVEATGYWREESIGRKTNLVRSDVTPHEVHENLWATILAGDVWSGELMNRRKNGQSYWESTHIAPLTDEDGRITHFIAVKEEITQRKAAEAKIAELTSDLERQVAERTRELRLANRELENFNYSVAHDLRAPLRLIDNYALLMERQDCATCGNEQARDHLQRIQRSARRMSGLIDDLLDLANIAHRSLDAEEVDVGAMAREILAELKGQEPGREVAVTVADGIRIHGDPRMLRILLENLLGNAWKFSAKRDDARIEVGETDERGERTVFVRDNGAGFDAAYADQLFLPFRRLHCSGDYPGNGIGLAIARAIVVVHGGRIWAQGEVGRGATFSFVIPEDRGT